MQSFYQPIALAFALATLRFAGPLAHAETPSSGPRIGVVDQIVFGDDASEQAHGFAGTSTRAETAAALGEPARVSLPKEPADYYGGDLTFTLHTDPKRQNYFTVKYWGSDVNGGQKALLYIEGEQLGYRHLGDYEALNHGTDSPSFRGRFFYGTTALPLPITHGRDQITLTIRTLGPVSGYALGGSYDNYQGRMTRPSRGYYRAYTHTTAALAGLETEAQGSAPPPPPVRPELPEISANAAADLDAAARGRFTQRLNSPGIIAPGDIADFARLTANLWPTLDAPTQQQAVRQLVAKIDAQSANAYEPNFFAKGVYQGDWGGSFASVAAAVFQLNKVLPADQWPPLLDETITVRNEPQTRRAAWTRMLKGNFDYARTHIARITNQAMFCLHGAYRSNRALQIINPAVAEPEETAKRFLFEAAGIWPYLGNDVLDANGKLVGREKPFGEHYFQITDKGLTREFTYVAIYGEAANDLLEYWELYGHDEILKKALLSAHARAQMKHADFDEGGFRAMRMEGVIESRGPAYPDDVGYVQRHRSIGLVRLARRMAEEPARFAGEEWAPYRQIATDLVGYAQQMIADGQRPQFGGAEGLADYRYIKAQPPTGVLLPNTRLSWYGAEELRRLGVTGRGLEELRQHAWADEDNGVVAVQDGDLTMFVGLVMKANWGVNGIARVHCITPTVDRLATVVPDVQFDWNGRFSVRPDWTNVQFMNANNPPEGTFQALEGEVLPFAHQPAVQPGVEPDNPYCGYGNFYTLRYGRYLIAMNTTRAAYGNARTYPLRLPVNFAAKGALDLITRKDLPVTGGAVEVGPQSTVVLRMDDEADPAPLPMASRLAVPFQDEKGVVTVRWLHAADAAGYLVREKSSDGPWTEVGRTDGENSFTLKTPSRAGTLYAVAGVNEHGVGPDSPPAPIRAMPPAASATNSASADDAALWRWLAGSREDPNAPPAAPRELRGENIKKRVNLAWKVARRGSTYDVLRAPTEAGPFTSVTTGLTRTTWTDPTLEYGQRYAYTVVASARDGRRGPPTAAVNFAPVDDTLPAPWKGEDIGNVGAEGDDGLREGVFAVRGSGADVWGGADEFRFVHQPMPGDHSVVAHFRRQQDTGSWVKSGIMLRESLAPGARNVFLFQTPGEGLCLQSRVSGGTTNQTKIVKSFTRTPWLKLTRRNDVVTAFASADGHDWTEVGSATVAFPDTVQAGLAVCAHARGAINLTEFDHVEVQP